MPNGEFGRVIAIVKQAIEEGEAFVSLAPPYENQIAFVDSKQIATRLAKDDIAPAAFNAILRRINQLLQHILGEHEDDEIPTRPPFHKDDPELLKAQLGVVRQSLYSERLQNRYDLKRSSKAPAFTSIDWDVKIKIDDAEFAIERTPYATIKIRYQRDFGGDSFSIFGGRTFDSTQLNFTSEEVEFVIRVLKRLSATLRSVESTEKPGTAK